MQPTQRRCYRSRGCWKTDSFKRNQVMKACDLALTFSLLSCFFFFCKILFKHCKNTFITEKTCLPSLSACLTAGFDLDQISGCWFVVICFWLRPHIFCPPPHHCLHNGVWQNSYFSIYNINISVQKTQIQAFKKKKKKFAWNPKRSQKTSHSEPDLCEDTQPWLSFC